MIANNNTAYPVYNTVQNITVYIIHCIIHYVPDLFIFLNIICILCLDVRLDQSGPGVFDWSTAFNASSSPLHFRGRQPSHPKVSSPLLSPVLKLTLGQPPSPLSHLPSTTMMPPPPSLANISPFISHQGNNIASNTYNTYTHAPRNKKLSFLCIGCIALTLHTSM